MLSEFARLMGDLFFLRISLDRERFRIRLILRQTGLLSQSSEADKHAGLAPIWWENFAPASAWYCMMGLSQDFPALLKPVEAGRL